MSGAMTDSGDIRYLFRFGSAEFDQARFQLTVNGQIVDADRRPLELLNLLLEHIGEVLTREELYDTLWEGEDVGEGAIANAVSRLRRHLGLDNAAFIVTRPRVGYSFIGKVERIAQNQPLKSSVELAAEQPVPGRTDFLLDTLLSVSGSNNREVWKARSVRGEQSHVFKFTQQADGLRQLKREYTLSELLSRVPATADKVVSVCGRNFEEPPFYVEYPYLGPDLLSWAENNGQLSALSREARLDLFLQIADVVSAAHNVGVLHKDIKPANILIHTPESGDLKAMLTDFGSSHLMESQVLSEHGVSPLGMSVTFDEAPSSSGGTLLYLAPEVWTGESPSIRSDVFSLGIVLYQLISGDLRQGIPSDWRDHLDDDLLADDIQQATSSDPSKRLQSVAELADRLRTLKVRHQAAAEQQAKDAEMLAAREALNRSRARRPWLIAASLTLVMGLAVSLVLYQQALTAQKEAEKQIARAESINQFWQDEIIQGGNPYAKDQASIVDVLESASGRVEVAFKDDPATAGSIFESLGTAFGALSDRDKATDVFQKAYENYTLAYGENSPKALYSQLTSAYYLTEKDTSAALRALENPTIKGLNDASVNDEYLQVLYRRYMLQSGLATNKQQWAESVKFLEKAVQITNSTDFSEYDRLTTYKVLLFEYLQTGQENKVIEIAKGLLESDLVLSKAMQITFQSIIASAYLSLHDFAQAETLLLTIESELEDIQATESLDYIRAQNRLTTLYTETERYPESLKHAQKASAISEKMFGINNITTAILNGSLGLALLRTESYSDAIKILKSSQQTLLELAGEDAIYKELFFHAIAQAMIFSGKYDQARTMIDKINIELLQENQPKMKASLEIDLMRSLNNYLEYSDNSLRHELKRGISQLEGCNCFLRFKLVEMFGEPIKSSEVISTSE